MIQQHDIPLVIAYTVALSGWLAADRMFEDVWPRGPLERFEHPGREFGLALIGAAGVLVMGRLWSSGIRLPEGGTLGPLFAAINQVLIFAPILLVPVVRRQPWSSAWLPRGRFGARLLVGLGLASLAVTAYSLLRDGADPPWTLFGRIWRYENIDEMAQVFLEDLTLGVLFVRLAGAVGKRWATVIVASLFAAGHIPELIAQGADWIELAGLLRDAGLAVVVILVLQRSRDILWFWCVHFCLDMTQFDWITGVR